MNTYLLFSSTLNALLSSFLIFLVIRQKSSSSRAVQNKFILFCTSAVFWSGSYFFWRLAGSSEGALFWIRLLTVGSIFLPIFYFDLVTAFIGKKYKKCQILIYVMGLLFSVLTWSNLMIRGVGEKNGLLNWPTAGYFYVYFLIFFFVLLLFSSYLLIREWQKATRLKKSQIKYLLIGISIGFAGGATNFFLWYDINLPPYGNILTSIYALLTFYAITRHRLLDIKLVARRYSVYLASLATILVVAGGLRFLFLALFKENNIFFDIVILAVALTIAPFLKDYYYRFANQHLFSSLYDPQEVITQLSDKLRSSIELKKIFQHIIATITHAFHSKSIAILLFDEKKKVYDLRFNTGFPLVTRSIKLDGDLHSFFATHDEPIALNELQQIVDRSQKNIIIMLKRMGVELINPLNIKDKAVGLILMAPKESGDTYNEEDMKVLAVIGTQAAIALENALLFEETKKFTITLKKEVNQATEKLRDQNEKLQKLDQLKTEFVSVASHQLRTPLTATKWVLEYLSDALKAKATMEEKESLDELKVVNAKLIKLVNELLNISRIEEGRLKIDPKPLDLVKMIQTTMKEFMPLAKQQKLKVKESYEELPLINLDEAVISKAISNFLSNGIKYNKQGGKLEITVKKSGKVAQITIKDEGIGIPEAEKKNLFQKFYRASNAISSHTEGTGLGLYIAKNAIELSGGTLALDSKEGSGTTFVITLPLAGSKKVEGDKGLT